MLPEENQYLPNEKQGYLPDQKPENRFSKPLSRKNFIILILSGLFVLGLGIGLYYLHTEYGIFYSPEKKENVSLSLTDTGEKQLEQGSFPEAEKIAKRAIRHSKENAESFLLLARSLYAQDRLKDSRDAYLLGLAIEPDDFEMNFYLGNVYRDLGDFEAAETQYKKALELEPHNIICWINYAIFYSFDKQDWAGAAEIYKQALEVNPGDEKLKGLYEGARKNAEAAD